MTKQPRYTNFKVCGILSKTSFVFIWLISLIAPDLEVGFHIKYRIKGLQNIGSKTVGIATDITL